MALPAMLVRCAMRLAMRLAVRHAPCALRHAPYALRPAPPGYTEASRPGQVACAQMRDRCSRSQGAIQSWQSGRSAGGRVRVG